MSGSQKKASSEAAFDLEQQFIMRLPPGPAAALRQELQNESIHLKDRLSIEFQADMKKGAIRYGNEYIPAKLVDLPCIIESHKTVDMKTFYKTADICQMLIPTTEDDLAAEETEAPANKKKGDKDKKYMFNHGITPPLKNVRKRRFRKTLKKKYMEQPDIEKEVKQLFRADSEAISVKWELITTEDEKGGPEKGDVGGATGGSGGFNRTDTGASLDIDIFGELSTSDEDEEKDVNVLDSEDDASRQQFKLEENSTSQLIPQSQLISQTDQYLNMSGLVLGNQDTDSAVAAVRDENEQQESIDASQSILDS